MCAIPTYEAFTGTTTGRGFALYHDARTTLLYTYEASTVCRGRCVGGAVHALVGWSQLGVVP